MAVAVVVVAGGCCCGWWACGFGCGSGCLCVSPCVWSVSRVLLCLVCLVCGHVSVSGHVYVYVYVYVYVCGGGGGQSQEKLVEASRDTNAQIVRKTFFHGSERQIEPSHGWFFQCFSRITGASQLY